jgi:hypothetical protein
MLAKKVFFIFHLLNFNFSSISRVATTASEAASGKISFPIDKSVCTYK